MAVNVHNIRVNDTANTMVCGESRYFGGINTIKKQIYQYNIWNIKMIKGVHFLGVGQRVAVRADIFSFHLIFLWIDYLASAVIT